MSPPRGNRSPSTQQRRGESTHLVRVSHTTFELLDAIMKLPGRSYDGYGRAVNVAVRRLAMQLGIQLSAEGRPIGLDRSRSEVTRSQRTQLGLHRAPTLPAEPPPPPHRGRSFD